MMGGEGEGIARGEWKLGVGIPGKYFQKKRVAIRVATAETESKLRTEKCLLTTLVKDSYNKVC